jgi:hypothetical protein
MKGAAVDKKNDPQIPLEQNLKYLKLVFMKENYMTLAQQAAKKTIFSS